MTRDEIALAILLKTMDSPILLDSIQRGDTQEAFDRKREPDFPAALAKVAFIQADAFIEAGGRKSE